MALRQILAAPFVVDPLSEHTHTVVFLHRLPASTDDKALRAKVLSSKMTKDGKTLRLQFPTVRWVFPHAKLHEDTGSGKHWDDLTLQDCATAGLELGHTAPYIAQVLLQEARRAGGLDKVVLGGQGEAALAAHDALSRLRRTMSGYAPRSEMHAFVEAQMDAHLPGLRPWKLAGYVGMHPDNDQTTRDQRGFSLVSRLGGGGKQQPAAVAAASTGNNNINDSIIRHTPHEFIRGGYKETSAIWDGRRIDECAEFLASIGIARGEPGTTATASTPSFPAKKASGPIQAPSTKQERSAQQKYAEEVRRQKQRDKEHRQRILRQIEDQKEERKLRDERERVGRFFVEQAALERKARGEKEPAVPPVRLYPPSPPKTLGATPSSGGYVSPWQALDDDADDDGADFDDSDLGDGFDDDEEEENHSDMKLSGRYR